MSKVVSWRRRSVRHPLATRAIQPPADYCVIMRNQIYLLTIYSKSQQKDISATALAHLVAAAEVHRNV